MITKYKCKRCGFEWFPRTIEPKACPRCKHYRWNEDPKKEEDKTQNKNRGGVENGRV